MHSQVFQGLVTITETKIIGIDPGATGGSVAYVGQFVQIIGTPIEGIVYAHANNCTVWLEHVHAFPGQGSTSTFNFGKAFGSVLGAAEALGVTVRLVSPQRWQNALLERLEGLSTKEAAMRFVEKRFGLGGFTVGRARKPHSGYVDAACIAYWGAVFGPDYRPEPAKVKRKAITF